MKEFVDFLSECQKQYVNCEPCNTNCPHNFYCTTCECQLATCNRCMYHIQWANPPSFTYSCKKITFHYVLRFLNRFASEIAYAMAKYNFGSIKKYNVVSLGCGPGSEAYGLVRVLKARKLPITLDYQGYDLNGVWKTVQDISESNLSKTGHKIQFYKKDLFNDFVGFNRESVDLLILNYLLSDVEKFANNIGQKQSFIADLTWFVIMNDVHNILFNDNNYYGNNGKMDSGVQLMLRLIDELKKWQVKVNVQYRCFPYDPRRGAQQWRYYSNNNLVFPLLAGNNLDKNVRYCNSKQVLVHIS